MTIAVMCDFNTVQLGGTKVAGMRQEQDPERNMAIKGGNAVTLVDHEHSSI